MVDSGVALEGEELGNAHASGNGHAREIVAHEVDDHQVLGAILRALLQRASQGGIVRGVDTAWARALDRACLDLPRAVETQKSFGRCTGDCNRAEVEECGEWRRIYLAEATVQCPRRFGERSLEALREVRLENVAGDDVLAYACEGVEIAAMGERRPEVDAGRELDVGYGVGGSALDARGGG